MRGGAGDAGDADGVAADILTTGYAMKALDARFADLLAARHALGVTTAPGAIPIFLLALDIGSGVEGITTPMSL